MTKITLLDICSAIYVYPILGIATLIILPLADPVPAWRHKLTHSARSRQIHPLYSSSRPHSPLPNPESLTKPPTAPSLLQLQCPPKELATLLPSLLPLRNATQQIPRFGTIPPLVLDELAQERVGVVEVALRCLEFRNAYKRTGVVWAEEERLRV